MPVEEEIHYHRLVSKIQCMEWNSNYRPSLNNMCELVERKGGIGKKGKGKENKRD